MTVNASIMEYKRVRLMANGNEGGMVSDGGGAGAKGFVPLPSAKGLFPPHARDTTRMENTIEEEGRNPGEEQPPNSLMLGARDFGTHGAARDHWRAKPRG